MTDRPTTARGRALLALVTVLLTLGCAPAAGQVEAEPRRSLADWVGAFDRVAGALATESARESRSGDSWDHYRLAYAVDAFTSVYEATGDRRYLEVALRRMEDVVATARPARSMPTSQFDDDHLGWVSQRPDVAGREVPLFESYLWRYGARMLRVMAQDPRVAEDPALRERHARLVAFAQRHVFDKWDTRGREEFLFRSRTHMASHWAHISVELAELTDDPARRARLDEVADAVDNGLPNHPSSLRGQLESGSDGEGPYVWSDVWGRSAPAQDVAHANGDVAYVVDAHELGRDWSDEDLDRFAATLTQLVDPGRGGPSDLVDGSGQGSGWLSDGFVKLGRHDPAVQAWLEGHTPANGQFFAAMALNARRLAAGTP